MDSIARILAHNSGIDEILMIVVPLVVLMLLIWVTNKWAARRAEDD